MFENEQEKEYFNNLLVVGEMARLTIIKILTKLDTADSISKDEVTNAQADAINELKEEVRKLGEAEKETQKSKDDNTKTETPSYT